MDTVEREISVYTCLRTKRDCGRFITDSKRIFPLTNNLAERQLRSYVIFRKLSFFSQSTDCDKYLARGLSVILTCRQLGLSVYHYLRQLFAHNPLIALHNQQNLIALA